MLLLLWGVGGQRQGQKWGNRAPKEASIGVTSLEPHLLQAEVGGGPPPPRGLCRAGRGQSGPRTSDTRPRTHYTRHPALAGFSLRFQNHEGTRLPSLEPPGLVLSLCGQASHWGHGACWKLLPPTLRPPSSDRF